MDWSGSPSQSPVLPERKRAAIPKGEPPLPSEIDRLGRYAITGRLGRGGMGIVYAARDTLLQREVAIKLLPEAVSSNPEALARFLREAQGAARLNHPNVVGVYDVGEAGGTHYIVMELIDGANAQEMLRLRGPFRWPEATRILIDVSRGVAAAHRAGLIHRDIKPANILRSADGTVKLADFGLVKPTGLPGTGVTAHGEVVGTPHYMSPEQSRSKGIDERSDLYSLGATYFALLTGRPPFDSRESLDVLFAHCGSPVPDPRELVAAIPEACVAIIRKAMEKRRSRRHRDAGELVRELESILASRPARAAASRSGALPPRLDRVGASHPASTTSRSLAGAYPGERSESVLRFPRRRLRVVLSILACLVLAVLVAAAVRTRPSSDSDPAKLPARQIPPDAARDDWPGLSIEAEMAIRGRDRTAMKRVWEKIQISRKRAPAQDPAEQEAIRQTAVRLEKALAFRESISEKGLVLGMDGRVTGVLFSPDDRWLALGQSHGDAGAIVLDSHTGEKRHTLWPRRGNDMVRVHALAFDREGEVLAVACADNRIKTVRLASGEESSLDLGRNVQRALSLAFCPSSRNLVASLEPFGEGKGKPYLKIWNLDTGKEPFAFKVEHSAKVRSVAYCAGGHQVATGSSDKRVVMWNADTGRVWRELRTGLDIHSVACSPNGRTLAVAGLDQETPVLQFWDYAAENLLSAKTSAPGACPCVAFSPRGELLASGSGSRVQLWDPETQSLLATLTGHSQDVTSVAFSGEGGILVTGGADQTVRLWDVTRYLSPRPER